MKNNFKEKPKFFHSEYFRVGFVILYWVLGLNLELYTCWVGAPPLSFILAP